MDLQNTPPIELVRNLDSDSDLAWFKITIRVYCLHQTNYVVLIANSDRDENEIANTLLYVCLQKISWCFVVRISLNWKRLQLNECDRARRRHGFPLEMSSFDYQLIRKIHTHAHAHTCNKWKYMRFNCDNTKWCSVRNLM